jgi:DNA-binding NtrC family response regulator
MPRRAASGPRPIVLSVVEGPDAGRELRSASPRVAIGTGAENDVVLADPTVSRQHCALERCADGIVLRDLESTNGTFVREVRVREALIPPGTRVSVGRSIVEVRLLDDGEARAEPEHRFGPALGRSPAMQRLFRALEQVADADVRVLLSGETGTGKGLIARAMHAASPRAAHPFVVVDCATLPPTLIEAELFGHEKGAFTGADTARAGAFEAAQHGTLLLDEIGELPLALQPKLLRALEDRQVKRIGSTQSVTIDVRLIAATHRDLAAEVKAQRFRTDLYYRLNVVKLRVPALRERPEDIRLLAESFARALGATLRLGEDDWRRLEAAPWPGNVRELRAAIERAHVLGDRRQLFGEDEPAPAPAAPPRRGVPFREAKRRIVDEFERAFVEELLAETRGNVSEAARRARMDRNYLRTLIGRHLAVAVAEE